MSFLLDTNILTRAAQPGHAMHQVALDAVAELRRQRQPLHIVAQNFTSSGSLPHDPSHRTGLG
jgi:hypothetical protein